MAKYYVLGFHTATTIIALSRLFSVYKLFVSNNSCSLDLYSGDLQTTTVLFYTQCVFTQDFTFDHMYACIRMIELWFQCHSHTSMMIRPFWAYLDHHWTILISPERCPNDFVFIKTLHFSLPHVSCLKHP